MAGKVGVYGAVAFLGALWGVWFADLELSALVSWGLIQWNRIRIAGSLKPFYDGLKVCEF